MNEKKAKEILGDTIREDGSLYCLGHYTSWDVGDKNITLDCEFKVDELEAIVWWVKNKTCTAKKEVSATIPQ